MTSQLACRRIVQAEDQFCWAFSKLDPEVVAAEFSYVGGCHLCFCMLAIRDIFQNRTINFDIFTSLFEKQEIHSSMVRRSVLLAHSKYAIRNFFVNFLVHGLKGDDVRLSSIVNERPQVMNWTVLRSNFDACRCQNNDGSSSVDLKAPFVTLRIGLCWLKLPGRCCMMLLLKLVMKFIAESCDVQTNN